MLQTKTSLSMPEIIENLLNNNDFITILREKLNQPISVRREDFDRIIDELSELINLLIQRKMEYQMTDLIADNNNILEQIKDNVEKSQKCIDFGGKEENSFSDIHNLITEEKKKMLDQLNDAQMEKSISMLGQYDDFVYKVNELQRKVKAMEEKYETNFKSLWNVLSMTESAMFDYIKENKVKILKQKEQQTPKQPVKQSGIFSVFWK